MNKRQSDVKSYMSRTGSHATKPSRRGDTNLAHGIALVTDVDPIARRAELCDEKDDLQETIKDLNRKLRISQPFEGYEALKDERVTAGNRMNQIDHSLGALNDRIKNGALTIADSLPSVFLMVAGYMLPEEVFVELKQHAVAASQRLVDEKNAEMMESKSVREYMQELPQLERDQRTKQRSKDPDASRKQRNVQMRDRMRRKAVGTR